MAFGFILEDEMFPVLLKVGAIRVYSYGLMVALGTLIATFFCQRLAAKRGLQADKIIDVIFWMVLFGLLGGRILYVLLNFNYYSDKPIEIIQVYKGGLAFHGSFITGIIAALAVIKKNGLPLLKTLDIIAVYVPLAHAFGRIGCFLNGCCYGKPTQFFLGITFPGHFVRVHPTQLYSAFLLSFLFVILLFVERKKQFSGQVFFLYLILYGAMRFSIEFLRGDNPVILGPFTIFQLISMGLFFSGLCLYFYFSSKKDYN